MAARNEPELVSWTDFLMSADPALPYLALFKALAQLAFVALGGDDIDLVLNQARLTVETWTAERDRPRPDADDGKGPRPVGHREAGSARIAMTKQGEAKRRLFERGCENVARLFYDVLKRHAFDRRDPWEREADAPPPPPVDPALEEALKIRAQGFMVMAASREGPARNGPGPEPFDERKEAEMAALKMRNRELEVHFMQMGMHPDADEAVSAEREAGPEHALTPQSQWGGPGQTATLAQREPTDIEITAFSLALVEGEASATVDMPEESLGKLKELQKWFASHDTSKAPRAVVAAFVRRKFNQVFDPEMLRQAARRSIVRLTTPEV